MILIACDQDCKLSTVKVATHKELPMGKAHTLNYRKHLKKQ